MPRITKAEVRAAAQKNPKKTFPVEKKGETSREKEVKKDESVFVKLEGAKASDGDTKNSESTRSENRESNTTNTSSIKNQTEEITKKVTISNYDPTIKIKVSKPKEIIAEETKESETEDLGELSKTIIDKLQRKIEVLESKEEDLLTENANLLEEVSVQKNLVSEIKADNAAEKKELIRNNEEIIENKDLEITDLNMQIDGLKTELNTYIEKENAKDNKLFSAKIGKVVGEIVGTFLIVSVGSAIVMLIVKLIIMLGGWLF